MHAASWTCAAQVHPHTTPVSGEGQASGQAGHNGARLHHRGRRCAAAHVWRGDSASPSALLASSAPASMCHKQFVESAQLVSPEELARPHGRHTRCTSLTAVNERLQFSEAREKGSNRLAPCNVACSCPLITTFADPGGGLSGLYCSPCIRCVLLCRCISCRWKAAAALQTCWRRWRSAAAAWASHTMRCLCPPWRRSSWRALLSPHSQSRARTDAATRGGAIEPRPAQPAGRRQTSQMATW